MRWLLPRRETFAHKRRPKKRILISLEHSFWPTAFRVAFKKRSGKRSPLAAFFSFAPRRTRPAGRRLQAQRFGVCLEKRPDPLRAGVQVTAEKKRRPPEGEAALTKTGRWGNAPFTAPSAINPGGRNGAEAAGADARSGANSELERGSLTIGRKSRCAAQQQGPWRRSRGRFVAQRVFRQRDKHPASPLETNNLRRCGLR